MCKIALVAAVWLQIAASPADPAGADPAGPSKYFRIHVIDAQTRRGIPLVELETTNNIRLYTDSNGLVAFYEPGLMHRKVFFHVRSHGYEFPKDGFGMAGRQLDVSPGGRAVLEMKRINIAERLYRVTGGGIYRDTVLLGEKPPIREPLLNALVFGSDSVMNVIYRGRLYWFWGDTGWPAYPLGNFHMTAATSRLPSEGGLDPAVGVDLEYFVREDGFARSMAPIPGDGPTWLSAFCVLREGGRERLLALYAKIKPPLEAYQRGVCEFDPDRQIFQKTAQWDLSDPLLSSLAHLAGGQTLQKDVDGREYVFCENPFPLIRVPATAEAFNDLRRYEGFTCLQQGSAVKEARIDRTPDGTIRYAWRPGTPPLSQKDQADLVKAGRLRPEEALIPLRDVDTGKEVLAHAGTVYWNEYRRRWILIVCEIYGTSVLGEIWYAEADTPAGPWVYARKVVTHDKYSFYNPRHHPYFDQDGGRLVYFEGTYTIFVSGATYQTPRYDYNQIMYRLDLADPRLALPVPVYYRDGDPTKGLLLGNAADRNGLIAFFAPDRAAPGTIPVYLEPGRASEARALTTRPSAAVDRPVPPLFYALPPDAKDPPPTTAPLYEWTHPAGGRAYATADPPGLTGFRRSESPLCRVWTSPISPAVWRAARAAWGF